MDALAEQGRLALAKATNPFEKSFLLSEAMNQLRSLLTPEIMKPMMALQGSALGFKTDQDSAKGYSVEVVKDCIIEGALRGLYPVGNEINIIAGRCYAAKSGLARLVKTYPGLTDLVMTPGIPVNKEGGTLMPYSAAFKLDGKDHKMDRTFPIRVNSGMIVDAIMGKAKRKMYAAILEHVTGSEISEGEAGDDTLPGSVTGPTAAKREPLKEDIKPANVTSETTLANVEASNNDAVTATSAAESSLEAEIAEHDRLLALIRADQEKNGWSDDELVAVLKDGMGFPKHSATIKTIEDTTNKFLTMVVNALPSLNKAIAKNRTP